MKLFRATLLLGLTLLLPVQASAQKDNKFTKEAAKFLGVAMTKPDAAARAPLYEQALVQLQQGLAKEPENAKVHLMLGQAYVGLNRFLAADSAFDKAVAIYPAYAEEINAERENGWIAAFNAGSELMGAGKYPEAIAMLEQAQALYAERPEALMNLGALYANQNQMDKSAQAFEGVRAAVKGPVAAKLNEEQKAAWKRFDEMAQINLAQLIGQKGVDAFAAKSYVESAAAFAKAAEMNPVSRDYVFNLSQSLWAQAAAIEEKLDSMPKAQQPAAKQELITLYSKLDSVATLVQAIDPSSELIYIIQARAHRMMGEYTGDKAKLSAAQNEAVKILEQREALAFELSELMVTAQDGTATIRGSMKNRKLAAGATQAVKFTLLGIDGRVVGEGMINMTAPEKDAAAAFEGTIPVNGEVAGWKYSMN